jgi:hypothetical protein
MEFIRGSLMGALGYMAVRHAGLPVIPVVVTVLIVTALVEIAVFEEETLQ